MGNFVVDEARMFNSPYNNMVLDLKNCYLLTDSDFNENCSYGCEMELSKNCLETNLVDKSELSYEIVNCQNCYRAFYSVDCESSADIWFCKDCNGCTDCFGCVGLRKQKYQIFNEQYSREDYIEKIKSFNIDCFSKLEEMKKRVYEFWQKHTLKYMHEKQNENVSGDYIYNSRNVQNSWIVHEGWNLKYCQYLVAPNVKDSYDISQFGKNIELFYEILQGGNGGSNVKFSWFAVNENFNMEYSIQVMTSKNCFGCIGLRKSEYCILNKQYTKEEYEELLPKIKEQMNNMPYVDEKGCEYRYGEFFPSELSPFAYNETSAQEYFPLSEPKAMSLGYKWKEPEPRNYQITVPVEKIPEKIFDVADSITGEIIACANKGEGTHNCTTAFRVIPDELGFYKQMNLPIPHKCPNCRHHDRMKWRNPPIFRKTKCDFDNCEKELLTAYSNETKEKIYCKEHYLQTVV
jgi:hypothetical protein